MPMQRRGCMIRSNLCELVSSVFVRAGTSDARLLLSGRTSPGFTHISRPYQTDTTGNCKLDPSIAVLYAYSTNTRRGGRVWSYGLPTNKLRKQDQRLSPHLFLSFWWVQTHQQLDLRFIWTGASYLALSWLLLLVIVGSRTPNPSQELFVAQYHGIEEHPHVN
ncbi:hypothetical protein BDN72DRAFT_873960 [Pluteus cervinus]|uniref:Uncharacterized protein n=1 Tax=Pluteus cervinus TaxID=181527 RepID=A0ACD3BF45_9AGAR|nr:hypothetical protein BDN72DRAFT_873960 [Pluteus cervinus]